MRKLLILLLVAAVAQLGFGQESPFPLYNGIYVTKPYYATWREDSVNNIIRFYSNSIVIYSSTTDKIKNIEKESNWFNIDSLSDNVEYTPTSHWKFENGKITWVMDAWKEYKEFYKAEFVDSKTIKVSCYNTYHDTTKIFQYHYIPVTTNLEELK